MGNKYNIPESIQKSIAALLEPYGLDFERILTQAETNAASPRSTRGYCNCAAAAKYLHCSTQTIWRMVKRGIIPGMGCRQVSPLQVRQISCWAFTCPIWNRLFSTYSFFT